MTDTEKYAEEARQKWGNMDAYAQSQERVKNMGKEGLQRVLQAAGELTLEIAACMKEGEKSTGDKAQQLIARHYDGLRAFYEPNVMIYRGLAEAYVTDERFKANYENVAEGLAQFMSDAMRCFADAQEKRG